MGPVRAGPTGPVRFPAIERHALETALNDPSLGMVVEEREGPPEVLLLAFGGIASQLDGVPPFEFLSVLDGLDVQRVFVRDLDQCWYQRGVRGLSSTLAETDAALARLVARVAPRRLVTLGTSAGGFGAIYFGCALGADVALAFGPQTFTSRRLRLVYRDRRWVRQIAAIDALDQRTVCRDLRPVVRRAAGSGPEIEVHVGASVRVDRAHARRLRGLAGVTVIEHPGGHNVSKDLRDRGELRGILTRAVTGEAAGA